MANDLQTDDVETLQIAYQDGKYRTKETNSLSSSGNSSMESSVSGSTRSSSLHGQSLRNSQESNFSELDVEEDIGDEDLFGYGEKPSAQISNGNEKKDSIGIGVDHISEATTANNTTYIESSKHSHLLNRDNGKIASNSDAEEPSILLHTELNGIGYCETMLHSLSIKSDETTSTALHDLKQTIDKYSIHPKGREKKPPNDRPNPLKRTNKNINGPPLNHAPLQFADHNLVRAFCSEYAPISSQLPSMNTFVQNHNQNLINTTSKSVMFPPEITVDKLNTKVNSDGIRLNYPQQHPQNNPQLSTQLHSSEERLFPFGLSVYSPPPLTVPMDQTGYQNVYISPIDTSQNIPQVGSINTSLNGSNSSLSSNSTRCYSSTHDVQYPGSVESSDVGSPCPIKNYGPVVDRQYSVASCNDFVSIGTQDSSSPSSGPYSPLSTSSSPRADVPPISTIPTLVYESTNRFTSASSPSSPSSSSVSPLHRATESALSRRIPIPNSYGRIDDGGSKQPIKASSSSPVNDNDSDSDSDDDGNTEAHSCGYMSYNSSEQLENSIPNKNNFRRQINISNKYKRTPLYIAVICNNWEVVSFFLDQGADPSKLCFREDKHKLDSKLNENVLHLACEKGLVKIVQVLLDHPAKHDIINTRRQGDNQTPLLIAINEHSPLKCRLEIIKMLVNNGASMYDKDMKTGRTPLMLAISKHELELVLKILEGCDPWERKKLLLHKDYDGNTCLHMVAQIEKCNMPDIIITKFASKLVLYGADLEAQNVERISPKDLRRDLVIPLGRFNGSTIVPPPPSR